MTELSLAAGFPEVAEADWRALVEKALKGTPFESLRSATYDGIAIEPLYARVPAASTVAGRAPGEAWTPMQRIDLPDSTAANVQILEDLNNGAQGLVLVFDGDVGDYGYALPATKQSIETALAGVLLDAGIDIELAFGPPSRDAALIVSGYLKQQGFAPASVNLRFGFDPLGALANGIAPKMPWAELAPVLSRLVGDLAEQGFKGPFFAADGRPIHAAGGSEAQELGFVLAAGTAYLRALEASGMQLEDAQGLLYFRLAADQDQFLTIAKFRALRKLWARIEAACGLAPKPAFIAAETAWRMMTKNDPYGNIVRSTIAALGAALGGADAITVLPFTAALGVPDAFARRIARNTQTILIEESNLHRVADPAAGSGAIEALTDAICQSAWTFFQEIERAGGAAQALQTGLIHSAVARVRDARNGKLARRKEILVGASDFPDLGEQVPATLSPATLRSYGAARLAEPFEHLRDRSDAYFAEHGERPKIFLATLGRPADFNARASFAKNLFEAGGIEAVGGRVYADVTAIADAFATSGATLACLCSSDKVYAADGVDAARALREAGATHIYLAGKPKQTEQALTEAGVGTFVYQGCDTLQILQKAYERLD